MELKIKDKTYSVNDLIKNAKLTEELTIDDKWELADLVITLRLREFIPESELDNFLNIVKRKYSDLNDNTITPMDIASAMAYHVYRGEMLVSEFANYDESAIRTLLNSWFNLLSRNIIPFRL